MDFDSRDDQRSSDDLTSRTEPGVGPRRPGWSLDGGLIIGVLLIGIALSVLVLKGFNGTGHDAYESFGEISHYDPYFNGGYLPVHVNTASREELLLLPMISERIADGIISRRPFKLTEELLEVRGIGELNLEIISMYLYGFEDAPEPRLLKPPGIPDA